MHWQRSATFAADQKRLSRGGTHGSVIIMHYWHQMREFMQSSYHWRLGIQMREAWWDLWASQCSMGRHEILDEACLKSLWVSAIPWVKHESLIEIHEKTMQLFASAAVVYGSHHPVISWAMGPIECTIVLGMLLALVVMYMEMKRMSMKFVIYMNELAILITDVQLNQHALNQFYPEDGTMSSSEDEAFLEDQKSVDLTSDQLERRETYRMMTKKSSGNTSAKDWNQWAMFQKLAHCSGGWLIRGTWFTIHGGHGLMGGTLCELLKMHFFKRVLIRNRSFGKCFFFWDFFKDQQLYFIRWDYKASWQSSTGISLKPHGKE